MLLVVCKIPFLGARVAQENRAAVELEVQVRVLAIAGEAMPMGFVHCSKLAMAVNKLLNSDFGHFHALNRVRYRRRS